MSQQLAQQILEQLIQSYGNIISDKQFQSVKPSLEKERQQCKKALEWVKAQKPGES